MVSRSGSECCVGGSNPSTPTPSPSSPPPVRAPTRRSLFEYTEIPRRNPSDECFSCKRKGHWAQDCPNKSPKKLQPGSSSSAMNAVDLPPIRCPCGRGVCPVRTSSTERNPGRMYFACPAGSSSTSGGRCNFFLWCDEVADFRVPKCPCGAGSCSPLKESSGPNAGRWYFACRLKKGHGACLFLQWADLKQNNLMNKHLGRSNECSSPTSHQVVNAVNSNDSGNKEDLEFPVTQNFESSSNSPMMIDDLRQDVHNGVQGNLAVWDIHSCGPMKRKISQIASVVPRSGIYDQQTEFSRQISAPGKTLNEGPESDIKPSRTSPEDRASSRELWEPSGPKNCTSSVCQRHEDHLSECILGACGQKLLHTLESLNPVNHGKMLNVAEVTFDALHRMSIDHGSFSEVVKEFIQCSAKLSELEGSVDKEIPSEELVVVYSGKKAQYDNASHLHKEALGALKASENHLKSLGEEISYGKGMLFELEKQRFSCEAETLELQGQVAVRYKEMVEAEGSLDATCKEMEEASELEQQRESAMHAAQAALERARRVIKLI